MATRIAVPKGERRRSKENLANRPTQDNTATKKESDAMKYKIENAAISINQFHAGVNTVQISHARARSSANFRR